MTISQALSLLKPYMCTKEALKKAYREACKTFHPDVNPDGLEMMKMVNAAYDLLSEKWGQWDLRDQDSKDVNFASEILEALAKIRTWPGLTLEVCGTWLWISGMTYNYKTELKSAGFKWSPNKTAWYFHPSGYRKMSRRQWGMDEIRGRFGSQNIEPELREAIA